MLAISAARISTASSPSRKTMIALFATTAAREPGPRRCAARPRASASSSAARVAASSAAALRLTSWTRPSRAVRRRTRRALDLAEEPGREAAQPLLGAELEDAVRLEPRLLGPPPLARRGRGSRAGRAWPRSRRSRPSPRRPSSRAGRAVGGRSSAASVVASTASGSATASAAAGGRERVAELGERRADCRVAAGVAASSTGSRSANAPAAPSRNVIASWISKSRVTWPSSTPRPYSIGTSSRNRSSWPARRSSSASAERRRAEALERRSVGRGASAASSPARRGRRAAGTPRRASRRGRGAALRR